MQKVKFKRFKKAALVLLSAAYSACVFAQTPDSLGIVYVKPTATGTGMGTGWGDATDDLQGAINAAGATKVFVAVGTYPATTASFIMKNNVAIYGGFDPENGVNDLSDNRILPNLGMGSGSVLDGLNARPLIWNDNNGLDNSAILDGFTLTNGYSNNHGGAIYTRSSAPYYNNLVISNCKAANGGGGIHNNNSPIYLGNAVIESDSAKYGAAIFNQGSNSTFENLRIFDNVATQTTAGAGGGAIFNDNSDFLATNVLIYKNTTGFQGGAFVNLSGNPTLTNVTIANNTADVDFSGLDIRGGNPTINNSIILDTNSGVYVAKHSLIEGNADLINGNLDATGVTDVALFNDPANDDYSLLLSAVALNAGHDTLFMGLNATTKDLAGNSRKAGISIDLGAYEYQAILSPDGITYVKPVATGTGFGNDWANATGNLQEAINSAGTKVFVAVGNYIVPPSSFSMKSGVEIYGGFDPDSSGITNLSHSRILPNLGMGDGSVLDGQNTRRVIFNAAGVDSTALLDGFTLTNGKSTGNGGAIYNVGGVSPTFNNLVIKNNEASEAGAGLYNNTTGRTRVSNTIIKDNTAAYGGGVYNNASNAVFTDVSITGNTATMATVGAGGGGFFNTNANPSLTNVLIADNATNFRGGGFVNLYGTPVFTNVTLADNVANVEFDAMDVRFGNPQIHNTIVWGDIFGTYTAQYSLVEGDTSVSDGNLDATGITAADIFTDAANADYSLTASSPAVNAGNNALFAGLSSSTVDLARNPRLFGATIDLGAYEKQCANSLWTDTRSECFPYTWIDGNTYNAATNTVVYRIPNASGCDSVITLNLTETVIDTVVTQNQQTLTAAESNADSYQWIDCANNMPVSGATSQTYTPTANGIYAVEITVGDCEITSECVVVSSIGIGEAETGNWSVYPNPAGLWLNIVVQEKMEVQVLNMMGQVIRHFSLHSGNNSVDVGTLTPGIYVIQATSGASLKFIKE